VGGSAFRASECGLSDLRVALLGTLSALVKVLSDEGSTVTATAAAAGAAGAAGAGDAHTPPPQAQAQAQLLSQARVLSVLLPAMSLVGNVVRLSGALLADEPADLAVAGSAEGGEVRAAAAVGPRRQTLLLAAVHTVVSFCQVSQLAPLLLQPVPTLPAALASLVYTPHSAARDGEPRHLLERRAPTGGLYGSALTNDLLPSLCIVAHNDAPPVRAAFLSLLLAAGPALPPALLAAPALLAVDPAQRPRARRALAALLARRRAAAAVTKARLGEAAAAAAATLADLRARARTDKSPELARRVAGAEALLSRHSQSADALRLPEHILADLLLVLSWHPDFVDTRALQTGLTDSEARVETADVYHYFAGIIRLFIDALYPAASAAAAAAAVIGGAGSDTSAAAAAASEHDYLAASRVIDAVTASTDTAQPHFLPHRTGALGRVAALAALELRAAYHGRAWAPRSALPAAVPVLLPPVFVRSPDQAPAATAVLPGYYTAALATCGSVGGRPLAPSQFTAAAFAAATGGGGGGGGGGGARVRTPASAAGARPGASPRRSPAAPASASEPVRARGGPRSKRVLASALSGSSSGGDSGDDDTGGHEGSKRTRGAHRKAAAGASDDDEEEEEEERQPERRSARQRAAGPIDYSERAQSGSDDGEDDDVNDVDDSASE
jgi:hypothetical protein